MKYLLEFLVAFAKAIGILLLFGCIGVAAMIGSAVLKRNAMKQMTQESQP